MLALLGEYQHCDIYIKPFGVEIDGYFFGLVLGREEDEDSDDSEVIDDFEQPEEYLLLEPNDIMFHPPWDSGNYST